jgi:hypothetical protein
MSEIARENEKTGNQVNADLALKLAHEANHLPEKQTKMAGGSTVERLDNGMLLPINGKIESGQTEAAKTDSSEKAEKKETPPYRAICPSHGGHGYTPFGNPY